MLQEVRENTLEKNGKIEVLRRNSNYTKKKKTRKFLNRKIQ